MRNYLITGGTDGIGRAAALLLADQDSRIILIGRNRERGEAAEREVRAAGGWARFL
jgi:NAD(P)-dependent dehydrogenase (short-subunit alcohol dehydrogenase family)